MKLLRKGCYVYQSLVFVLLVRCFICPVYTKKKKLEKMRVFQSGLVKGAGGGGLHRNSLEIDFIVVSDRGE